MAPNSAPVNAVRRFLVHRPTAAANPTGFCGNRKHACEFLCTFQASKGYLERPISSHAYHPLLASLAWAPQAAAFAASQATGGNRLGQRVIASSLVRRRMHTTPKKNGGTRVPPSLSHPEPYRYVFTAGAGAPGWAGTDAAMHAGSPASLVSRSYFSSTIRSACAISNSAAFGFICFSTRKRFSFMA